MGNKENFDQLMLADNGGLTVEQQAFKDLHESICYNAKKSAEHWVDMASGMLEMRDSKSYRVAGFDSFGDYTENALGIKERQAYNYISVIEKLPEAFIKAHASIGVTKLALLTSVTDEEREEILGKIDLDNARTPEINEAVHAALAERDEATKQLSIAIQEKKDLQKENSEYQAEYLALAKEQKAVSAERKRLEEENEKLKARLAEIAKEEPTVLYQADPEQEKKLDQAKQALIAEREEKDRIAREVEVLQKQLKAAENAKVDAPRVEIKGDTIVVFKVKFEAFQDVLDDMAALIGEMDATSAEKCKTAVHVVFEDSGI